MKNYIDVVVGGGVKLYLCQRYKKIARGTVSLTKLDLQGRDLKGKKVEIKVLISD